jgi:ribosomal protein L21E
VSGEAFSKGDVIHFSGTAVVTAVKQQDKRDGKTGQVVGCEQQHTALITDLTVG